MILGVFYFGQMKHVAAPLVPVIIDNVTDWVAARYRNVVIEIDNECWNPAYARVDANLRCDAVSTYIGRVHARHPGMLVSASVYPEATTADPGHCYVDDSLISAADFVLIHGNRTQCTNLGAFIDDTDTRLSQLGDVKPVVVNEDDHYGYGAGSDFMAALSRNVSWGFFDSMSAAAGEDGYYDVYGGYQSLPINYGFNTQTKRDWFATLEAVTGTSRDLGPYVALATPRAPSASNPVTFRAAASDADCAAVQVTYWVDGAPQCVGAGVQFACQADLAPGTHMVYAEADDGTATSTSRRVAVSVP